jgi:release factor glutamine methyltransferase
MSSVAEALKRGAARLSQAGLESARLDARVLMAHVLGLPSNEVALSREALMPERLAEFEALIARRAGHEPVAYLTDEKEFYGLTFDVGAGALVPRPESEILIEEAFREFPDRDAALAVLDLGTGTGCLLLSFLTAYPKARGLGIDSSAEALDWAARNVRRHGLEARAELARSDWNELPAHEYEVVLANPPYVATPDLDAAKGQSLASEPRAALDGGPDGLDAYRALALLLPRLLSPAGRAFLEIGLGQGPSIVKILELQGLSILRIANDLADIPRCLVVLRQA